MMSFYYDYIEQREDDEDMKTLPVNGVEKPASNGTNVPAYFNEATRL